jgi:hypothetical protein
MLRRSSPGHRSAAGRDLERLTHEKAELVAGLRFPPHEDFVNANIRQSCASANARCETSADFDAKRQFLMGHIERVIYNRDRVTLAGSFSVQSASGDTKLQFRIEGEIDRKPVRSQPRTICPNVAPLWWRLVVGDNATRHPAVRSAAPRWAYDADATAAE